MIEETEQIYVEKEKIENPTPAPKAGGQIGGNTKPQTHVSDAKKQLVKDLAELMKKKTVMVVSIKNLPAAQFQEIKKKLRGKAVIRVAKKSLVDFALEHCGIKELRKLEKYVDADVALLFSDGDAFEISGFLSENKSPAKAKEGQEAPEDIEIKAGPTSLIPGPDISALSGVGLQPKVEGGKIHILKDAILCRKGEKISSEKVSVLAKLDITPFEIMLEPVAACMDGKIYADIKIDKEATLEELKEMFGRALAFSVEVGYVCKDNLIYVLGRAGAEENVIDSLIEEEKPETKDDVTDTKSAEGASKNNISEPQGEPKLPEANEKPSEIEKSKSEDIQTK